MMTILSVSPCIEHPCETADDLIEAIRPRRATAVGRRHGRAIWRGQREAALTLVPSALRKPNDEALVDPEMVLFLELRRLQLFVEACDRSGVPLPNDGADFRSSLELNRNDTRRVSLWPRSEHYEAWAVAQHHGVPTRLLDWTDSPWIAAYFAARDALLNGEPGKSLAIFALEEEKEFIWRDAMVIFRPPRSRTRNLSAQMGLFTIVKHVERRHGPSAPRSVEDAIVESLGSWPRSSPLHKYTLPHGQAADLLESCEQFGVTAGAMFPGYDGAARELEERLERYSRQENWTECDH